LVVLGDPDAVEAEHVLQELTVLSGALRSGAEAPESPAIVSRLLCIAARCDGPLGDLGKLVDRAAFGGGERREAFCTCLMPIVSKPDLTAFAEQLLPASHASADDARLVSEALVWSDLRARHPQGVLRLPNFVQRLERGLINSPARFAWQPAGSAAAVLDAGNGFGHVAGHAAMQRAIELAGTHGVGVTAVRHSNLYGAAAWFCSLATDRQY